jgi:hypothetical protein
MVRLVWALLSILKTAPPRTASSLRSISPIGKRTIAAPLLPSATSIVCMGWSGRSGSFSTLLESQATLNNRSDVRHRFYWWSNGGIQAWDDTRVCYPMRYSAAHGFADVDHWPVDSSGTDLSIVGNHTHGPVSRFVYGSREPFMGIWNPHTNACVAHFADYS